MTEKPLDTTDSEPLFLDEPLDMQNKTRSDASASIAELFADENGPNPWHQQNSATLSNPQSTERTLCERTVVVPFPHRRDDVGEIASPRSPVRVITIAPSRDAAVQAVAGCVDAQECAAPLKTSTVVALVIVAAAFGFSMMTACQVWTGMSQSTAANPEAHLITGARSRG
jgi:hypothetical protein